MPMPLAATAPPDTPLAPIIAALQTEIGNLQTILDILTQVAGGSSGQPDTMLPPVIPHPTVVNHPSLQGLGQ